MNLIKTSGLKHTKGREKILQILQKEDAPVDVMHIGSHLKQEEIQLNESTLYRILESFYQKGIVDRFEFQEGKFRYELRGSDHHHLICELCGAIEDFSDCSIKTLEKEIRKKKRFIVKRHSLEFFGICRACSN